MKLCLNSFYAALKNHTNMGHSITAPNMCTENLFFCHVSEICFKSVPVGWTYFSIYQIYLMNNNGLSFIFK